MCRRFIDFCKSRILKPEKSKTLNPISRTMLDLLQVWILICMDDGKSDMQQLRIMIYSRVSDAVSMTREPDRVPWA